MTQSDEKGGGEVEMVSPAAVDTSGVVQADELAKEHESEARFPWGTLLLLLRCWVVVMILSMLKGGHGAPSIVGAACGTAGYWGLVALNVPAVERIYLSEMLDGGAFAWLQHNVALNAALSLRAVHAIPCDWAWFGASGDTSEQEEGSGDTAGEEAADAASEHVIAQALSLP